MPTIERTCEQCKRGFLGRSDSIGRFCSQRCLHAFQAAEPIANRFFKRVAKSDTCWLWTGAKTSGGYGSANRSKTHQFVSAHRLSWELHRGPIANGLCVLHRCDVRACVNPAHLFLGTYTDNARDCSAKCRQRQQKATRLGDQAVDVRAAYALGGTSFRKLSAIFGVAPSTIRRTVRLEENH